MGATATADTTAATLTVSWRNADGTTDQTSDLNTIDPAVFLAAEPAREIPNSSARQNKIGLYWSATSGRHVKYESRLESEVMLWLDQRVDVDDFVSQPFLITSTDEHANGKHYPDILVALITGEYVLIDVKSHESAEKPKSQAGFDLSRSVADACGWAFAVHGELTEPHGTNLRFLKQYRRTLGPAGLALDDLLDAVEQRGGEAPVGVLCDALGGWPTVMPVVGHALWHNLLTTDLFAELSARTVVRLPGGGS